MKLSLFAALSACACAAQPPPTWAPCCGALDTLCAAWSSVSFSPASPQAGDTLIVNASGVMGSGVVLAAPPLAAGAIDATHGGSDVFGAPIATCGETSVSVLGLSSATIDALPCPTEPNERVALAVTFPIPALAKGMGAFNVTINATDNAGSRIAFCLDVVVTV